MRIPESGSAARIIIADERRAAAVDSIITRCGEAIQRGAAIYDVREDLKEDLGPMGAKREFNILHIVVGEAVAGDVIQGIKQRLEEILGGGTVILEVQMPREKVQALDAAVADEIRNPEA